MAQYDDLFVRARLGDDGQIPRTTTGLSNSPDIIPYGIMPVDNPVQFFSGNFNSYVAKDIVYNANNYIYLRGENLFNGARNGEIRCYYAPSNLLLYPSTWRENILFNSSGQNHIAVSSSAKNTPFVTPEPFVWQAPFPPSNSHFCMISQVSTESHPNPIPNTGDISSFAEYIASNGGMGWRNVRVVATGSPDLVFSSNYEQKAEPKLMDFLITTYNAPIGSEVWFSSGTPVDGEVIKIPPSKVTQKSQTFGTQAFIPANWTTTFNWAYRSNGGTPGPGFNISLRTGSSPTAADARLRALNFGTPIDDEIFGDEFQMWDRENRTWNSAHSCYTTLHKNTNDIPEILILGADGLTDQTQE